MTMRLSYYGNRAGDDPADRTRYAVASWKDGYAKDEEMGYIFRCILNDYGYSYEAGTDGKVCFVKVMIADYDEFILIKEFFDLSAIHTGRKDKTMKTWYLATFKWSDSGVYCTKPCSDRQRRKGRGTLLKV